MIAIIGAGPAGISLAAALDRQAVDYVVFEAAEVGSTWDAAPKGLRVLSPWWCNVLHMRYAAKGNPFRKARAEEYLDHLRKVCSGIKGVVRERCRVQEIQGDEDSGWFLQTSDGRHGPYTGVVLATGYYAAPRYPDDPLITTDGSVVVIHAAEVTDYERLESMRAGDLPVVVVGARVTAGQLLLELERQAIPSVLSARSPVRFRRHGFWAYLREMAYFFWEELEAWAKPGLRRASYPVMEGGRTRALLESGKVPVWPAIKRTEQGNVVLSDGRKLPVAGLILATGYNPVLDLLPVGLKLDQWGIPCTTYFELDARKGIYLLGYDNLYDHRSRYLRGIRKDAVRLAAVLKVRSAAGTCAGSSKV